MPGRGGKKRHSGNFKVKTPSWGRAPIRGGVKKPSREDKMGKREKHVADYNRGETQRLFVHRRTKNVVLAYLSSSLFSTCFFCFL